MYKRLQYISQGNSIDEQLQNIREALEHGCQWIQLRFKKATSEDSMTLAKAVKILCQEYSATFIINDNVPLALEIDADGVHLGLKDMKIANAREILGKDKIIGGTANTLEDIKKQINQGADYIGLGPFRFTKNQRKPKSNFRIGRLPKYFGPTKITRNRNTGLCHWRDSI